MDPSESRRHLATLAATNEHVLLGPAGVAAYVSPECEAYRALAAMGSSLAAFEAELTALVRGGSPAGIVYGALLLRQLGRDVRPDLAPYLDDERPCVVMPGGCHSVSAWLGEAVRWVVGESRSDPRRVLRAELATLARASWFELPDAEVLAALESRQRVDGSAAKGVWAFAFARLWLAEAGELARVRPQLEELARHHAPAPRVYAALLLGRLAAPAALAGLETSRERLPLPPSWLGFARRTTVGQAVADVIREARFLSR